MPQTRWKDIVERLRNGLWKCANKVCVLQDTLTCLLHKNVMSVVYFVLFSQIELPSKDITSLFIESNFTSIKTKYFFRIVYNLY